MSQFGKYQLIQRLGAGGMAEVFLARSTVAQGLEKLLVIKKIQPSYASSPHFLTMFVNEAKIALGLNHPNVVQVFDFGQVEETYFLAMEYIDGMDLLRLLQASARERKRVGFGLAAYIVHQIAKGLDYAHRKTDEYGEPLGIVHRDISPQNVLVSRDGAVKIVDFGIARARGVYEEEGVVKGKFAYMSPEQARGEPVDHRADIFSSGVVLFELVCGRPLFPGKGKAVLESVKTGNIPRPRDWARDIPKVLEDIILQALAFKSEDRYQTARDLQTALSRFQFQQAQDDFFDSATLAQYVAQILPPAPGRRPYDAFVRTTVAAGAALGAVPHALPPAPIAPEGSGRILIPSQLQSQSPSQPASGATDPARASGRDRGGTDRFSAEGLLTPAEGLAPGPATQRRERKHVMVIEAKLDGLDSLRRRVGEERARRTVQEFFRIAADIAYKHEAHPARLDAGPRDVGGPRTFSYIVGLPAAGEDDAARAVRLSLALVDALDGIGADVEPELRLAVGIQRGHAIVSWKGAGGRGGLAGEGGSRWDYELSEATTAIARRLAKEARGGEVLVGGGVYRVTAGEWNYDELTSIELPDPGTDSGAARAKVYRLRGAKERAQRLGGMAAPKQLMARELELKTLRDVYREVVVRREKRHIFLVGDAGVGKRTIVNQFLHSIAAGEAHVMRAAARAATSQVPYGILADLARDFMGLAEGAELREVQRRIELTVDLFYTGEDALPQEDRDTVVSVLGRLLGVKEEGASERDREMDAEERRLRIGAVMRKVEERLSAGKPLISVIEDAHWADSQSWEVLVERVSDQASMPVLGVITTRPDPKVLRIARETNAVILALGELGGEDREAFIRSHFDPIEEVGGLVAQITAHAGGNPLFIREVIASLVDRGIIEPSDMSPGTYRWVKRDVPLQVPASLEALVATRLERLPAAEREVITRAAILGRQFSAKVLGTIIGEPPDRLLPRLVKRGLLRLHDPARATATEGRGRAQSHSDIPEGVRVMDQSFEFKNDTTRQVAYDLVPQEERIALHRRIADELVRSPSFRSGQDDVSVAQHLASAGAVEEAAGRYLTAARQALDVSGLAEGFEHLTRALQLLPAGAHALRYEARAEREAVLRSWARRSQQLREIHLMRREAEALGDKSRVARTLVRLAQLYVEVNKTANARAVLEETHDAARAAGDPVIQAAALRVEAHLARSVGEYARCLELCDRALSHLGNDRAQLLERAEVLSHRGSALWSMSRLSEAVEAYAEALVIYRKLGVLRQEARALNNLGIVFATLGEFEEALAHYKRSLKLDADLGNRSGIAFKLGNIGQTYLEVGELEQSERYLRKALAVADQISDRLARGDAVITLGQVYMKRGEAREARHLFAQGLELATENRSRYEEIRAKVYLGLAQLMAGDPPEKALRLARSARDLAEAAPLPVGEMYAVAVEGLALGAMGQFEEAAAAGRRAVQLLGDANSPEGAEEILFIAARLARGAGRHDDARATLERAHVEVQSKARRLRDSRLRASYLAATPVRDIVAAWDRIDTWIGVG